MLHSDSDDGLRARAVFGQALQDVGEECGREHCQREGRKKYGKSTVTAEGVLWVRGRGGQ